LLDERALGIRTKIVTGDNRYVSAHIAAGVVSGAEEKAIRAKSQLLPSALMT